MSEALIFASTNPQYDNRLFIVHENCKLRIPVEYVVYKNGCFCFILTFRTILVHMFRAVASGGLRGLKPPSFLADQLTLFQPEGAHSPYPVLQAPWIFRPCNGPVSVMA